MCVCVCVCALFEVIYHLKFNNLLCACGFQLQHMICGPMMVFMMYTCFQWNMLMMGTNYNVWKFFLETTRMSFC